jgi:hypothetical protein
MACGLLFDGIHRNIEKDTPEHRLSNIARLYRAFPSIQQNTPRESYDAFYISGLGTLLGKLSPKNFIPSWTAVWAA